MGKKTALRKLIFKEIWTSKARFLSILILILLGVGFFAGLQATGPNMLTTADDYFDQQHLYDIHIQSTLGFEDEEIQMIADYQATEQLEAGYSQDVLAGEQRLAMKLIGYHQDQQLNQYIVNSGRLPENSGEIALDNHESIRNQYEIGDQITLYADKQDTDLAEQFNVTTYEVVGFVTSPRYITEDSRGQTTIGRGQLDAFGVIIEDDFNLPVYTDLFATFTGLRALDTYGSDYQQLSRSHQTEIEQLLEAYGPERLESIRNEAEEDIADAEAEIADGRAELDEARQQLDDAKEQLNEGREAIAKAEAELEQGRADLEQGERDYQAGLESFTNEIADGEEQLEEGKAELKRQQTELDQGRKELEQGSAELTDAKKEIDQQRATLVKQQEEFKQLRAELNPLFDVPVEYVPEQQRVAIIEETASIELGEQTLADLLTAYFAGQIDADKIQELLNQVEAELEAGLVQLDQAVEEVSDQQKAVDSGRTELEAGQEALDQGKATLTEQESRLERERNRGQAELNQARTELDEGWNDYQSGRAQLDEEQANFIEAEAEYDEGLATFEDEQGDALAEIEEAEADIAEARVELADLEEPSYYPFIREDNGAFIEYADNADRLSDLASIFPVVFFAIAALVTLTTITRMIEEQRGEIGTLKALGYLNGEISLKYFAYAISASLLGTVFGLLLGYLILPRIIYDAYRMLYNLPDLILANYWLYTVISLTIALLSTVLTAWIVLRVDLRSHPSVLMRPRAPKIGKRILIERITPLWKRLSFIEKVTARNLFRYKQRMLMTVFGIAGCAALIVTGFGLKGAVEGLTTLQFGDVMQYNAMVILDQDASEQDATSYHQLIAEWDGLDDHLTVYQEQYEVAQTGQNSQDVHVIVPEEPNRLTDFIHLTDRTSDQPYQLTDDGAIVSEKLATLFDVQQGDTLTITDADNESYPIEIAEITENYTGHYLYMTEAVYRAQVKDEPIRFNADLLNYDQDRDWEDALSDRLMEEDMVVTTSFNASMIETFEDSMESLNVVVIVLIIAAAGLAFVVLYNLTNINVSERIRELSTIKVLGFYDGEVTMYIYRENLILTIMGIVAGSFFGRILHVFVLETASMDNMMFSPNLHWSSYLYAAILTFVFSTFVMWIMHRKLKSVDMIEALKSNE
ncbi:ABC transporter permease [Amphibacillus jilinensis]|uniref:ABC transporter permease n=1 Tax=Amphibacillus jilinensis TaxID=1216008 RepID=UPI000319E44D|nr:ABC transporter permease [Amphibacillus jilinensis]